MGPRRARREHRFASTPAPSTRARSSAGNRLPTTAAPGSRSDGAVCIYYVGGSTWSGDTSFGTSHADCFQADGFLGQQLASPVIRETFTPTRRDGAAIILEPFLYVAGGTHVEPSAKVDLADVSFSRISEDGSLAPWIATAPLPEPMAAPAIASRASSLYLVAPPSSPSAVLRAVVRPDGSLDGWRPSGTPLPSPRATARAAILGDFLYVVGGAPPGDAAVLVGHF